MCEILSALDCPSRVQGDLGNPPDTPLEESQPSPANVAMSSAKPRRCTTSGLLALEVDQDSSRAWSLNQASLVLFRQLVDYRMESNVLLALARVAPAGERRGQRG